MILGESEPLMRLAITVAKAVASRFRAVPPMVWSAFRLMAEKASRED